MPIELQITKLVYGGDGLASHAGKTYLVPFTLPGERVLAEVRRQAKGVSWAHPIEWLDRDPARVDPPCPVYGRCGGCQYQHISYEQQLEWKRRILIETLARVGRFEWTGPVETVSADPWGYRNRTQIRLAKRDRKIVTGFLAPRSRQIIQASECPINSPVLNRVQRELIVMAGEKRFPDFLHEVEVFTSESEVLLNVRDSRRPLARSFFDWCAQRIEGWSQSGYIDYKVGEDVLRVGNRAFFQVNRFLAGRLAELAVGDRGGDAAVDLYSGVGPFTVPLARRFRQVTAVESSARSTRDLQFNAERAGVQIRTVHMNVEDWLPNYEGSPDFVVADPPRAGLGPKVTFQLVRIKPARLVLVSCDPATLARDLAVLLGGGFQMERLTLVDMFPQTHHIECVAELVAASPRP